MTTGQSRWLIGFPRRLRRLSAEQWPAIRAARRREHSDAALSVKEKYRKANVERTTDNEKPANGVH